MIHETIKNRRGFLKGLAAVFGGFGAFGLLSSPAQAGPSRWRGRYGFGGFGGYGGYGFGPMPMYRVNSRRRFYGAPGFYGGFRLPMYGPGYYGAPYVAPAPVIPAQPFYYNNFYAPPIGSRTAPAAFDALRLLEA